MALGPKASIARSEFDTRLVAGTTYYVQFHLGDPGAAGTANLAAYTTRTPVIFAAASTTAAATTKVNTALENIGTVSANETWTHASIWSALTSGNFIESTTVSGGNVFAGTAPTIAAGAIVLTRTNAN